MFKKIFMLLNEECKEFFEFYKKFYMERFIYSSTEIEGIKTLSERKTFVQSMLGAFNVAFECEKGQMGISEIMQVGNIVNKEYGLEGFRKIDVYAGDNASFIPVKPYQIYTYLYALLDNYYNVWTDLDPFLKEAMFHINFMRMHPFEDGNKRTSKIILASNLLKSYCAPVIITEEDTKDYYNYINNLDYEGLAEFLRQRSKIEMDTLVSLFKMKYNIPMEETPDIFKIEKNGR